MKTKLNFAPIEGTLVITGKKEGVDYTVKGRVVTFIENKDKVKVNYNI